MLLRHIIRVNASLPAVFVTLLAAPAAAQPRIEIPRVERAPAAAALRTPAGATEEATDTRGGFDAKVIVRDAVTIDVAANPDFSQVESDQPQVTANQRFEVYVGYTAGFDSGPGASAEQADMPPLDPRSRQLFVKLSYLFRM